MHLIAFYGYIPGAVNVNTNGSMALCATDRAGGHVDIVQFIFTDQSVAGVIVSGIRVGRIAPGGIYAYIFRIVYFVLPNNKTIYIPVDGQVFTIPGIAIV